MPQDTKPLRVLIVEDDEDDAALMVRELSRAGFDPLYERVDTPRAMAEALRRQTWDVILSDYSLPSFSGPEALALLKTSGQDIPFIIISGTIGEEAAVAGMRAGAHDYLVKGHLARLGATVERELRDTRVREENRRLHAQFLQSQKMEGIGRLAGGVAHDFNNLLTAILGYCNLLTGGGAKNGSWKEDVEEIKKAALRAASLTHQLLAFSRNQMLQPRVLDLNTEIRDIEKMLRRTLGEDVQLTSRLRTGLWRTKVDVGQLQQVLVNLSVNARDAMPKGGSLEIATENVELKEAIVERDFAISPGRYVVLSVKDEGTGMDENVKLHLFEPFFTTKEPGKGTGLGLSTVYGIVRQSGGHISVHSEKGKGATFRIYLPSVDDELEARPSGTDPAEIPAAGSETILIVDDEDAPRGVVRRILVQSGYNIMEARKGQEALDMGRRHRGAIHLLLTDMVLPDFNGLELAKRLAEQAPQMKVLVMSGYFDRDFDESILDGSVRFLQKPFTSDVLTSKVREALAEGATPKPRAPSRGTA